MNTTIPEHTRERSNGFERSECYEKWYLDSLERLGEFIVHSEEGQIIVAEEIYHVELEFRDNGAEVIMENRRYHYHKPPS